MSANMKEELQIEKLRTEINKMIAETAKVNEEIKKVGKESKWYEVVIIVSATLAVVAIVKLFL